MKKITYIILVCFALTSFVAHAAGITRSAFTLEIKDKEPTSNLQEISTDATRIYFFTEIIGLNGHTITHRWEYNGKVLAEINFAVNANRWRTWSSKNMLSSWTGKWQVSVLDEGGNIIEQKEFEYVAPKAEEPIPEPMATSKPTPTPKSPSTSGAKTE